MEISKAKQVWNEVRRMRLLMTASTYHVIAHLIYSFKNLCCFM